MAQTSTKSFGFKPFSPKQLKVILDPLDRRINILEGSVRSGKTIASAVRFINYVGLETSPGASLLMLGVTVDTLKRNVINDILDIVGPKDAHYKDKMLVLFGRIIYCVGANDVKAEKRIRGMTVEGAYIDEATQIPKIVIEQAILRCSAGKGRVIFTTNPDTPFHWFYKEYVGNEKKQSEGAVKVWHFELDDNYALSEDYKKHIRSQFQGLWYLRMVLGRWVMAEGAIYDLFNVSDHGFDDDDIPLKKDGTWDFDYYDIAVDYGTQNAFAALLCGVREDETWVLNEYYYSGRESMKQKTDGEYVSDIKETLLTDVRFIDRFIVDPSATSFITQARKDGIRGIMHARNDVLDGIRLVSHRLRTKKLRVHRLNCPNIIREFGSYIWDPDASKRGEDKPLKKHDHSLDALRYHEYTMFAPSEDGEFYIGAL